MGRMIGRLLDRRIPQYVGLYVAGGWGFVQFVGADAAAACHAPRPPPRPFLSLRFGTPRRRTGDPMPTDHDTAVAKLKAEVQAELAAHATNPSSP
jgi:hypothetical protein